MSKFRAPALEMLWETSDPKGVIETRFNFSDGDAAGRWVATTLDEYWGVQVDSCERIVMSGHNALAWVGTPAGPMLAKWSVAPERFPRLTALAQVTAWLDGQELPVSAPVAALDGQRQVQIDGASVCLQRQINGDLLDTTDPDQVQAAGAVLARLHDALEKYPHAAQALESDTPSPSMAAWITGWLDSDPQRAPVEARDALRRLVTDAPEDLPPTQLLHGDFRSSNILCAGTAVTAVIDFEEARYGHRIDELTRSAVMLGTRFRDWGPVSPQVRADLLDGYQSEHRLTATEAHWWDILVLFYSLTMIPSGDDPTGWRHAALTHLRKTEEGA